MAFTPDGHAKEDRVTKKGFGQPDDVETREFRDTGVSANWFDVPTFGDWERYFYPRSWSEALGNHGLGDLQD